MNQKSVYLAGPISGLNYDDANDWRKYTISRLDPIKGISPLRGKEYLANEGILQKMGYRTPLSTDKAITIRDRYDASNCDALLVNFLGAKKVSIGTIMEIAWADAHRVPIVVVMEENNVHQHAMLNECSMAIVDDLELGIDLIKAILL